MNEINLNDLKNLIINYPKSYNLLSSFYEFIKININQEVLSIKELNHLFLKFERVLIKKTEKVFKSIEKHELNLLKENLEILLENSKELFKFLNKLEKIKIKFFNKRKYSKDYEILEQSCLLSFYLFLRSNEYFFILATYDERLLSKKLKKLLERNCDFILLISKPEDIYKFL